MRSRAAVLAGPVALVLIWLAMGWLKLLNPLFLPLLPDVLRSLWRLTASHVLLADLAGTAWRTFAGFAIAIPIGVPAGLVLGSNEAIRRAASGTVDFLRSIPGTALFPLFLLFFGIGDRAKIANAVFACSLIMLVNAMYGVRNANKTRVRAAKTMGASPARVYLQVVLPSALPEIAGGLRIAISIALIVVVVTEMFVGTASGLGKRIYHTYQLFQISDMYAAILVTGIFGYLSNAALVVLEKRLIHWGGK